MKKIIFLIIVVLFGFNINAQIKAFDNIYFDMTKKDVRVLSKFSDSLHFGDYSFFVNPLISTYDGNNKLVVLGLSRCDKSTVWIPEYLNDDKFKILSEYIFDTFIDANFTLLYKNDFYNSAVFSERKILFIFQNNERTIYLENNGILPLSKERVYIVRIKIMTNEYAKKIIDQQIEIKEKNSNELKNKL
jgi:hypothetical protein